MITLYLYPGLFGLPDNNPYGLKVDTFLRMVGLEYKVEHIVDTQQAPRGQLPYMIDDDKKIGDSNQMLAFLIKKYNLSIDDDLDAQQQAMSYLVRRILDEHLYWVISYSRWQDPKYWPLFKKAFLETLPDLTGEMLEAPRKNNIEKYYYQGIGRYEPPDVYQGGIIDLSVISALLGDNKFLFGHALHSIDACVYGFLANIYYFDIDTPLKQFICSKENLVQYCKRIRAMTSE